MCGKTRVGYDMILLACREEREKDGGRVCGVEGKGGKTSYPINYTAAQYKINI